MMIINRFDWFNETARGGSMVKVGGHPPIISLTYREATNQITDARRVYLS